MNISEMYIILIVFFKYKLCVFINEPFKIINILWISKFHQIKNIKLYNYYLKIIGQ